MIAIVGVDCRFPGAADPAGFWDLLSFSGDGIGEVPEQRWNAREFYDEHGAAGHVNTTYGGFISDADAFDNDFFGIPAHEAQALDPQQRVLLQCVWRAVEDSGMAPQSLESTDTGVYVGVSGSEQNPGQYMVANRVSYHLNLKGPSLGLDTACSSSLVAVHLAAGALLSGECDYAIAAGVNIMTSPELGIFYTQTGLSAPDGRCKPFSAQADGIGRGEGVGVVVLRRLEDAIADGQQVYAVIRGSAVNSDGRSNGIGAPSRWAQQEVIETALRRADADPASVLFVEAHGIGTVLGDAIEAKALGYVFGAERDELCGLGSVKGNIGHAEGAAGIAGLIKAALALRNRIVPASRYASTENAQLELAEHGLRLLDSPLRLPAGPVRAGVSSFGLGGTNAHVVLESAARRCVSEPTPGTEPAGIFTVTATDPQALRRNLAAQADTLARRPQETAASLCWSSNRVKTSLPSRFAITARNVSELVPGILSALGDEDRMEALSGKAGGRPLVAFVFAGLGAQFPRMTAGLYRESEPYRGFVDEADEVLRPLIGSSVRDMILGGEERISEASVAEPAVFAVEYALARTLIEMGVEPSVIAGFGVGEVGAACVADVLSLEDAAELVAARSQLLGAMPVAGRMRSVRTRSGELTADVEAELNSAPMRAARERFVRVASELRVNAPRVTVVSSAVGRTMNGDAMDGAYWAMQAPAPVRFEEAMRAVAGTGARVLVEIGPRPTLVPGIADLELPEGIVGLYPCPHEESDAQDLAEVVAALFRMGADPAWDVLYPAERRQPRRLEPYVFSAEQRYWKTSGPSADASEPATGPRGADGVVKDVVDAVAYVGGYATGEISLESRLYEDLGFDSVMFMQLRDQIGERVPAAGEVSVQDLLPHVASVGDLVGFIKEQSQSCVS